eukprot:Rhum_TRINITY_DN2749_c0_g1::Rhum_TRINITY_DN2749_c0_g1_i1::g.8186::m.8186
MVARSVAAVLVASSVVEAGARRAGAAGDWQSACASLFACCAAALFLVLAARKRSEGCTLPRSPRPWLALLLPVCGAVAVRSFLLARVAECCPAGVSALFAAPSPVLLAAVPAIHGVQSGAICTDAYLVPAVCFVLFLCQYDFETACDVRCLAGVPVAVAAQSFALTHVFRLGSSLGPLGSSLACVFLGVLSAFEQVPSTLARAEAQYLQTSQTQAFLAVLQCACVVFVGYGVVQAKVDSGGTRESASLVEAVLCTVLGGGAVEIVVGATSRLSWDTALLAACVMALIWRILLGKGSPEERGVTVVRVTAVCAAAVLAMAWLPVQLNTEADSPVAAGGRLTKQLELKPPSSLRHYRLPSAVPGNELVNATLVFMDSRRKPILRSLGMLQSNFLACYPYPINMFVENAGESYKERVRQKTTSQVYFHDIGNFFDKPPNNITLETVKYWIEVKGYGRGHHFGYRMMCRFFSGVFATYSFLRRYEFYWRLDTDSYIRDPVLADPLRHMVQTGCSYGHMSSHRSHRDAETVTRRLYETVLEWAEDNNVPEYNLTRLAAGVCNKRGQYARPMYYNNFEIGSVALLTSEAYTSFFQYLDFTDGFMKYRWGDAPVRTIAVHLMLEPSEICEFEKLLPYKHGYYTNKVYDASAAHGGKRAFCPAEHMEKDASGHYFYPPRYIGDNP